MAEEGRDLIVRLARFDTMLLAVPFEYFSNVRPAHGWERAKV